MEQKLIPKKNIYNESLENINLWFSKGGGAIKVGQG